MENQKNFAFDSKESLLISDLLNGAIDVSDFRLSVCDFSRTKVTNLFRDSFPKFNSGLKTKITEIFNRYFFANTDVPTNEFWRFVDCKNFWVEIRKFHDVIYTRDMTLIDAIHFFEKSLFQANSKLNLDFLQKKIIEKLGKTPSSLYKKLAEDLGISEKKISMTLKDLNSRGIYLGGMILYEMLDLHEFFSFNRFDDFGDGSVIIDRYQLFPDLNITHGIMQRKKHGPSFYYVKNRKLNFNPDILTQGISIKDWRKHSLIQQKPSSKNNIDLNSPLISSEKNPYLSLLLRNCELDFKRPDIKTIAETHDISARTLFRIKSKLIENRIIQPNMIIENPDLLQLLIVSKFELVEFYNKVPFIRSYEMYDDFGDVSWLSNLSIFMSDFTYIYSRLHPKAEIYQVIKRQVENLKNDSLLPTVSYVNRKTYTNN